VSDTLLVLVYGLGVVERDFHGWLEVVINETYWECRSRDLRHSLVSGDVTE
jgi:hypothetical protein